jgi:hypothetical protein
VRGQSMSFISAPIRATSSCVSVTTLKEAVGVDRSKVLNVEIELRTGNPFSGQ